MEFTNPQIKSKHSKGGYLNSAAANLLTQEKNNYHLTVFACTVEPRLSGFLDYPDFFSGPNLVMNIY